MQGANLVEVLSTLLLAEVLHHVRAEEVERVGLVEVVPELLQPDRLLRLAVPPEQVDHLAVGADRGGGCRYAREDPADLGLEPLPVRLPVDEEGRERLP